MWLVLIWPFFQAKCTFTFRASLSSHISIRQRWLFCNIYHTMKKQCELLLFDTSYLNWLPHFLFSTFPPLMRISSAVSLLPVSKVSASFLATVYHHFIQHTHTHTHANTHKHAYTHLFTFGATLRSRKRKWGHFIFSVPAMTFRRENPKTA